MINTFKTLHQILNPSVESSAFLNLQGHILSAETKGASFFLSPIQAARFAITYFPLQDGDWLAVNDPHIGGVTPHGINFLGRIDQLIWSIRVETTQAWSEAEKWEQVGNKIPPLPIKMAGQLNKQIPQHFLDLVSPQLKQLTPLISKLNQFYNWRRSEFSNDFIQKYFQSSHQALKVILKDTPWSESLHKSRIQSGEILNAKISFQEKMCMIELTGSSTSLEVQINEKVVDSILIYGLNKSLNTFDFYNHGTENFFQVIKPRSSWLSHSEPKFPARSHLIGLPFLESHIKQMLLKMKRPVENWTSSKDGWFQARSLKSGHILTSDQLSQCWGESCHFIQVHSPISNGLSLKVIDECELLISKGGKLIVQNLKPGDTFDYLIA